MRQSSRHAGAKIEFNVNWLFKVIQGHLFWVTGKPMRDWRRDWLRLKYRQDETLADSKSMRGKILWSVSDHLQRRLIRLYIHITSLNSNWSMIGIQVAVLTSPVITPQLIVATHGLSQQRFTGQCNQDSWDQQQSIWQGSLVAFQASEQLACSRCGGTVYR